MSEYLSKKAVLEFIKARKAKFAGSYKDIEYGAYLELETIETHIESGAFDANGEVQRLRAALEKARTYIFNGYDLGYIDDREGCTKPLLRQIDEALSTTTGPTGAERVSLCMECDSGKGA